MLDPTAFRESAEVVGGEMEEAPIDVLQTVFEVFLT